MGEDKGLTIFEETKFENEEGEEFWSARDLAKILDYSNYRNFLLVIEKAKASCENSGQVIHNHFVDFNDMVQIGSGAKRMLESVRLSRYACYLIIQNADPAKEMVALGQTYFAIQTRRQELFDQSSEEQKRLLLRDELKTHNTALAAAAKMAGVVEPLDFAIFQNHGYKGLYGGLDQKDLHNIRRLKKSQKILDHMGSTELAANLFRATQTEEKLRRDNTTGRIKANMTHHEVGKKVRDTIKELGGTMPENLPPVEDIKKLERRTNKRIKDQS